MPFKITILLRIESYLFIYVTGELPQGVPKSSSSPVKVKIGTSLECSGTSLECSGTSESKKSDDLVRFRPSKVNNYFF